MSYRVYIGRLSSRASERDVEHFFRGYGKIRDVVIKSGFGFIVSRFEVAMLLAVVLFASNMKLFRSSTAAETQMMPYTI